VAVQSSPAADSWHDRRVARGCRQEERKERSQGVLLEPRHRCVKEKVLNRHRQTSKIVSGSPDKDEGRWFSSASELAERGSNHQRVLSSAAPDGLPQTCDVDS